MKTAKDLGPEEFRAYVAMNKWDYPYKRGIFRHRHGNTWVAAEYEWHDTPGATQIPVPSTRWK
jgi:hypothetical protein